MLEKYSFFKCGLVNSRFSIYVAENNIKIKMGLDIACMVSDLILRNNTKMNKSKNSINKGYVNSLILQVGYLLFYDAIFLIKIKKVLIKTKSKKDNSTL